MLDDDDPETVDVLWSEIFAALPPRLRRALMHRLVAAHSRRPSPPTPAWRARRKRLAERDDLLRTVAEFGLPGLSSRAAALVLRRWISRAIARRKPLDDPAGRILALNGDRAPSAASIRRALAQRN